MATKNSINNASQDFTIDPASGDASIQFSLAAIAKFIAGIDDTDGDAFKISAGSAIGTTDRLFITADGVMTLPAQVAFLNSINAEVNVTGDGTIHDIGSVTATTSIVDRNGDMTEGDGAGTGATFTAPVTGLYQFNFTLVYDIDATGGDDMAIGITSTDDAYNGHQLPTKNSVANFADANGDICVNQTTFMSLTAADTVVFQFAARINSKTDDVVSGFLSGILIE